MTLRMGDGPVANLPGGLDAYAGYVNVSGIGQTYPNVVATFPKALHLSITTNGSVADCADVESGAMISWTGYQVGYCAISNAQTLIDTYGRPPKLWTAHYTGIAHICDPGCGYGFTGTADGTQWTDHNGVWDESLLAANFFGDPPHVQQSEGRNMAIIIHPDGQRVDEFVCNPAGQVLQRTGGNVGQLNTAPWQSNLPAGALKTIGGGWWPDGSVLILDGEGTDGIGYLTWFTVATGVWEAWQSTGKTVFDNKGATGAAATVTVGTVATGSSGTEAAVTNSGTSSAAVLDFTIPEGPQGPAGVVAVGTNVTVTGTLTTTN
jgi:hypothetical protein